MKKIVIIALLLSISFGFSQELAGSFPIDLKSNRDIFQIVDDSLKEVSFFISDRKKVSYYLMDEHFNFKDTISSKRTEKRFKDILGYSVSKSNPTIYWSSKDKENICAQSFDLQNRIVNIKEFNINLDKNNEVYLQTFIEDNKFFILSVQNNSNNLMLYAFENDKLEKKEINLENFLIYKSNTEIADIYDILNISVGGLNTFETSLKLTKINSESLTSLSESAKKRKCYSTKNKIYCMSVKLPQNYKNDYL